MQSDDRSQQFAKKATDRNQQLQALHMTTGKLNQDQLFTYCNEHRSKSAAKVFCAFWRQTCNRAKNLLLGVEPGRRDLVQWTESNNLSQPNVTGNYSCLCLWQVDFISAVQSFSVCTACQVCCCNVWSLCHTSRTPFLTRVKCTHIRLDVTMNAEACFCYAARAAKHGVACKMQKAFSCHMWCTCTTRPPLIFSGQWSTAWKQIKQT